MRVEDIGRITRAADHVYFMLQYWMIYAVSQWGLRRFSAALARSEHLMRALAMEEQKEDATPNVQLPTLNQDGGARIASAAFYC